MGRTGGGCPSCVLQVHQEELEGSHLALQGPTLQVRGTESGNKPLMAGEGTQVGMQGAACGIQPSADE